MAHQSRIELEISKELFQRKTEIFEFIQKNKIELFQQALAWHSAALMPAGRFNILQAYAEEVVGANESFRASLDWITQAALEQLTRQLDGGGCEH